MRKPSSFFVAAVLAAALAGAAGAHAGSRAPWRTWWGDVSVANGVWSLSSPAPTAPGETHSALVTSPPAAGDGAFSFTVTTLGQLRTGSTPNPWEVAWAMFRFRDLADYYWFILKPNGWELGKKQGSDRQVFLATGSAPALSIGRADRVRIESRGARIRVLVDGVQVVSYVDPNPLPPGGSVGLYEEDSRVQFRAVSFTGL
jgi:hypothetical protein